MHHICVSHPAPHAVTGWPQDKGVKCNPGRWPVAKGKEREETGGMGRFPPRIFEECLSVIFCNCGPGAAAKSARGKL